MKKIIIPIFVLLLVFSCTKKKVDDLNLNTINIDINKIDDSSPLFDKIDIIFLETNAENLISNVKRVFFENDYIFFLDNKDVISIFDSNGTFVSNSKKVIGQGPGEYSAISSFVYNKYSQLLEVVTRESILFYDKNFNLISRSSVSYNSSVFKNEKELFFNDIFDLSQTKHILIPTTTSAKPYRFFIFDSQKNEIEKVIEYEEDIIAGLTMQNLNFRFKSENELYFTPPAFSYFHYIYNIREGILKKTLKLNFENDNVNLQTISYYKTDREKNDYLVFESDKPLPLSTFFTTNYIVTRIMKSTEFMTFFENRSTNTKILRKNKSDKYYDIPFFEDLKENILYAVINPYEIEKFIDKDLINKDDIQKIQFIKEDDNPIIVKYYLK